MRIAIVSDAGAPQVNGVVNTLRATEQTLLSAGHGVLMVTPAGMATFACPTYPEIRLARRPYAAVAAALRNFAPHCIHIATEGPLGLAARRYCLQRGLAFTSAYHTRFPEYLSARRLLPKWLTYRLLRWFHRPSKAVMVPTSGMLDALIERGFDNAALWGRGVDTALFQPRTLPIAGGDGGANGNNSEDHDNNDNDNSNNDNSNNDNNNNDDSFDNNAGRDTKGTRDGKPVFLYVGRISVEKNIEAFLQLDLPGTKWVIGDGPLLETLTRRYPQVRFLGAQPHDALPAYYNCADVFVFPSRTDTFGLVLVEAMACGVPVAAYPVEGPIDVVANGVAGVLDEDLHRACLAALALDRQQVRAHASTYSWQAATSQFLQHLHPV